MWKDSQAAACRERAGRPSANPGRVRNYSVVQQGQDVTFSAVRRASVAQGDADA